MLQELSKRLLDIQAHQDLLLQWDFTRKIEDDNDEFNHTQWWSEYKELVKAVVLDLDSIADAFDGFSYEGREYVIEYDEDATIRTRIDHCLAIQGVVSVSFPLNIYQVS